MNPNIGRQPNSNPGPPDYMHFGGSPRQSQAYRYNPYPSPQHSAVYPYTYLNTPPMLPPGQMVNSQQYGNQMAGFDPSYYNRANNPNSFYGVNNNYPDFNNTQQQAYYSSQPPPNRAYSPGGHPNHRYQNRVINDLVLI